MPPEGSFNPLDESTIPDQHKFDKDLAKLKTNKETLEERLRRLNVTYEPNHLAERMWAREQQDPEQWGRERRLRIEKGVDWPENREQEAKQGHFADSNPYFPHARANFFPGSTPEKWHVSPPRLSFPVKTVAELGMEHRIDKNIKTLKKHAPAGTAAEKREFEGRVGDNIWHQDQAEMEEYMDEKKGKERSEKRQEEWRKRRLRGEDKLLEEERLKGEEREHLRRKQAVDVEWEARQGKVRRYYHSGEDRNPGEEEQT